MIEMIIDGKRSLAHVERIAWVKPIEGADNIELIGVLGWTCIAKIGDFKEGDHCVYIEIDSKVPDKEWSQFLKSKKFKIKTMKLGKFNVISQGLALPLDSFDVKIPKEDGTDVTELLEITYSNPKDIKRKREGPNKYQEMMKRRKELFKKPWAKWFMEREWGMKMMFFIFGDEKDGSRSFPKKFEYIHKTDQERCENMPDVLNDKTPFIRTEKCDGSSGTYILELVNNRLSKNEYEFYVCSRNLRVFDKDTDFWDVALKYDIENKLKDYLEKHEDCTYVAWQGEVCGPDIQDNRHDLSENHLYCFHMIDSEKGRFDIREAKKVWDEYGMESIPIVDEDYILPDDFEEFKLSADGYYSPEVCEGNGKCEREGFVYYKTTNPNFSFKNVSRKYLLKIGE